MKDKATQVAKKGWITEQDKQAVRYSDGKKGKDTLKNPLTVHSKRKYL